MIYAWALPDLGEGIHEAEIVRWHIQEQSTVEVDQVIAEIQTDKALVEIPSPVRGRVVRIHGQPGDIVTVGTVLVEFETETSGAGEPHPAADSHPRTGDAAEAGVLGDDATSSLAAGGVRRRTLAAPAVRRRARELGVDINAVVGSGRGGRVTMRDVEEASRRRAATASNPVADSAEVERGETAPIVRSIAAAPAAASVAGVRRSVPADGAEDERIPLAGLRRVIAQRMVKSKYTAPHVTGMDEADVTELVAVKERMEAEAEARGVRLTYLPFVIRAVVSGLKQFPYLNASLDDEAGEIVLKHRYNIGIAVDTPDGLIVPVIKNADQKSLIELAAEVARLSEKARTRTLTVKDLQDGTFTISNIGSFGGTFATPIINHPEVAILATGRIVRRPMYGPDDQIVPRMLMAVSLTFDHRVLDGGYSARFMRHVIERLERPERLFLEL